MLRDRLRTYRAKRDFAVTAEPAGEPERARAGRRCVIQKHAARRLHYDFRLEHDGVLLSWACPKGPSLDPGDKRLAVRVEDHPVEYGSFEGTIPKGQYGGGSVMLWDTGSWEPHGDVDEGLAEGKLSFTLHGTRLEGGWALVRLRGRGKRDRGRENWLLIKERDAQAKVDGVPVTERATTSAVSGRSMQAIAEDDSVWRSDRADRAKKKSKPSAVKIPAFVAPQLATLVDAAPTGGDWLHEIKYDGYRALASIGDGEVVIRTRTGLDWTDKFAALVAPLARLPCRSALLDGEIAVADAEGHTDFAALQDALAGGRGGFGYYVFDLLHLDGQDLRALPLIERKRRLERLLAGQPKKGPLFYSSHVEGKGGQVFRQACDLALEGIVSKRIADPYRSGRTKSWIKAKCGMEQEFVIIGWRPSSKHGRPLSSLLLGVREEGKLRYCGRVGTGYSRGTLAELARELERHARKTPPVADIPRSIARHARFVEPVLVAEIAFRGWTRDNRIRQGSFKGLRADKPARAVVRERPMPRSDTEISANDSESEIHGVRITHPDRVLFAEQGVTKRALVEYYLSVAAAMLPHVARRPLALLRCPQGRGKECFFQKHASAGWPDQFGRIRIREKSATREYLYIEDERGLVAAAQLGVLELHIWGARADDVEHPDRMVFDLDPDEGLSFAAVKRAARELRERLEAAGLRSFPMVTGGKGIHVVVPLTPKHGWDAHKDFAEALARLMAEDSPDRFVATLAKAKRRGKIFVDYLRNARGATAVAPFSTRARAGAFVALPVSWQRLGRLEDAHPATIATAAKSFARAGDPWAGYHEVRQLLPTAKSIG